MLKVGQNAPSFHLPDYSGAFHSLDDYKNSWVILYFYPKDDTSGCTQEACSFRDAFDDFENLGVHILGISKDSPESHKNFSEKFQLPFRLLSDTTADTIKQYHSWGLKISNGKEYMGTLRNTFFISPNGTIEKIYEKVDPKTHTGQILSDIKKIKNNDVV